MSLRLHVSLCVEDCAQLESFGAIMNIRYISDRKIACAHESGYISLFHVNCTKFPESMTLDFIYSVACTKQPVLHLNCIPDREFIACSVSKSLCFLGFDEKTNKFSIKESLNLPYGGLCFSQYCGDVLVVGSWDGLVYFIDYKSRPSSLIDQSKWLFPNPIISIEEFFDPTGQIFDDESCKLAMISSKCGSVAIFKTRC